MTPPEPTRISTILFEYFLLIVYLDFRDNAILGIIIINLF
jgi:hypothetical protein